MLLSLVIKGILLWHGHFKREHDDFHILSFMFRTPNASSFYCRYGGFEAGDK